MKSVLFSVVRRALQSSNKKKETDNKVVVNFDEKWIWVKKFLNVKNERKMNGKLKKKKSYAKRKDKKFENSVDFESLKDALNECQKNYLQKRWLQDQKKWVENDFRGI